MDLFISSFGVIFPLLAMLLIGMLAKKLSIIKDGEQTAINRLFSKVIMPCFIFSKVYLGDIKNGLRWDFTSFVLGFGVFMLVTLLILVPKIVKDKRRQMAILLCTCRANTAVYGFPLALGILGEAAAYDVIIMLSPFILLQNAVTAIIVSRNIGEEKTHPMKVVLSVLKNPFIIAAALGIGMQALSIHLPTMLFSPVKSIGSIATPLSFLTLGTTFGFKNLKKNRKAITWSVLTKLVFIPLVAVSIGAFIIGFRGISLMALMCCFATPSSVSSYPITSAYGGDDELAGEIVTFTTILSLISMLFLVYGFRLLEFF
ncbi:MAG: AEC family transporter [Eubacteriales bacterium]